MKYIITLVLTLALSGWLPCTKADEPRKPNVLFIAVDDLRPQLNCYGQKQMQTPNLDRLASTSVLFERAYCMVPTCGASRASLMTGIRPTRERFVNYLTRADKDAPDITTMSTYFKSHGYHTTSLGKVYHHRDDQSEGWSQEAWRPTTRRNYHVPQNQRLHNQRRRMLGRKGRGPAYEGANAPESAYPDGMIAAKAIESLRELKTGDRPFFLAVGFLKPHLPFVCPKK